MRMKRIEALDIVLPTGERWKFAISAKRRPNNDGDIDFVQTIERTSEPGVFEIFDWYGYSYLVSGPAFFARQRGGTL